MPWVRFEDDYLGSPKLSTLSTAAIALDMAGIIYSARELRDGHLTVRDVQVLAQLLAIRRWQPLVDELIRVRRWVGESNGYAIHDYLKYQPSRAHVLAQRATDRQRKRIRSPAGNHQESIRNPASPESARIPDAPDPVPESSVNTDAAVADNGLGASRARARGQGGFQRLGSFLPTAPSGRQRRQQQEEIPEEVRQRLQRPPISVNP